MAPWGGIDLLLSTNPIAVAGREKGGASAHSSSDLANHGRRLRKKLKTAVQRGEPCRGLDDRPSGAGRSPIRNAPTGLLVPIAATRLRLALVFGLQRVAERSGDGKRKRRFQRRRRDAHPTRPRAIVAISIAAFGDVERVQAPRRQARAQIPRFVEAHAGRGAHLAAGEQSRAKFEERSKLGVPIPEPLRARLEPSSPGN